MSLSPRPEDQKRPYRRRRLIATVVLVLVLGLVGWGGAYAANAAIAELPEAAVSVTQPSFADQPDPAIAWPGYGAGAFGAVGFDGVLTTHGSDAPAPIASITKIVTALVILEAKPLAVGEEGPILTFDADDVAIYNEQIAQNGSVAPVMDGLQLTERQTLIAMLLPSANNYATSLALWAFGSESSYLDAVRSWLSSKSLTGTTVTDTSGLSPSSVSTPSDLVELGKLAIQDPTISSIVAQDSAVLPGIGTVENTNALLGTLGVNGMKTGTTDEAGACLLFSLEATVEGVPTTVVGVLLGGATHEQLDADIEAMIPGFLSGFRTVTVSTAGESFGTLATGWGQTAEVVSDDDLSTIVWGSEPAVATVSIEPVATIADGADAGTAAITIGSTSFDVPLVARGALTDPGFGWRISNPDELFAPASR